MNATATATNPFEIFGNYAANTETLIGKKVSICADDANVRVVALIYDVYTGKNLHNNKQMMSINLSVVDEDTESEMREVISRRPSELRELSSRAQDRYYQEVLDVERRKPREYTSLEIMVWEDESFELNNTADAVEIYTLIQEYTHESMSQFKMEFL